MKKILILSTLTLWMACTGDQSKELTAEEREHEQYDLVIEEKLAGAYEAIQEGKSLKDGQYPDAEIKLGHFLYFDTRLSKDGNNSCNSCHNLASFGVDHEPTSVGDLGKRGDRNSPTVLNAALHSFQFWDGRAKDIEEQAGMPILNPVEMNIPNKNYLVQKLAKTDLYPDLFKAAYPNEANPLTYENIQKAIGAFERTLITSSRFDAYLKGDKTALSLQEKKGLVTFFTVGCNTCHNGTLLGGNTFQKFGVHANYWDYTHCEKIDEGVYALDKKDESKKYVFKVPSLRNIEKTGPYFHDGSVKDLKESVKIMAKIQLNYTLSDEETENITAFLGSLTGEVPAMAQKAPAGI